MGLSGSDAVRDRLEYHNAALKALGDEWDLGWKSVMEDIQDYVLPRRGFMLSRGQEPNQISDIGQYILDGTATRAVRVCASGLHSHMTPPTRPWYRARALDPELMEYKPVRLWWDQVNEIMRNSLYASNFYNVQHSSYLDLVGFGYNAKYSQEDSETTLLYRLLPVGSFYMGCDAKGRGNAMYRRFFMPLVQIVKKWGEAALSSNLSGIWSSAKGNPGNLGSAKYKQYEIVHCITEREEYEPGKLDKGNLPWEELYYEYGQRETILGESGYHEFPVTFARWEVMGNDTYSTGPTADALLGDIKMLQKQRETAAEATHKMMDPPLRVPSRLMGGPVRSFPGGLTVDDSPSEGGIRALYDVRFDAAAGWQEILDQRKTIEVGLFNDLFSMMEENDRMTATEIMTREQKKMIRVGPVVERIIYDDLDPTLTRHFWALFRDGRFPPIPPDMQSQPWKFEYVSSLAQAARMSVMHTLTSTAEFVGMCAALDPMATKKFDALQAIDEFAEVVGTPVRVIRSDEDVTELIRQEQEKMAEQQALMEAGAAVEGAQKMSQTPMEEGTALSELLKLGSTGGA